jgi:SAM-dependent methyltransferase
MIKDYVPIDETAQGTSEIDFIESYWTNKLSPRLGHSFEDELKHRDEYRIIKPHLQVLPTKAKILDGGCGTGEWTMFLSRLGYNVTGLDISESLILHLKTMFPRQNFVCGDLRSTEFPDASFDLYCSWGAFEHFEIGLEPCLREAFRILKPGGLLFFSVPFLNWRVLRKRRSVASILESDVSDDSFAGSKRFYQWRFTTDEVKIEIEKYGLECLQVVPIHKRHGIQRMLDHDFGIRLGWIPRFEYIVLMILELFIPANYISHMVIASGVKNRTSVEG